MTDGDAVHYTNKEISLSRPSPWTVKQRSVNKLYFLRRLKKNQYLHTKVQQQVLKKAQCIVQTPSNHLVLRTFTTSSVGGRNVPFWTSHPLHIIQNPSIWTQALGYKASGASPPDFWTVSSYRQSRLLNRSFWWIVTLPVTLSFSYIALKVLYPSTALLSTI